MKKRGNYNNRPQKVPKNTEFEKKSGKSFRMCEGIVLKCLVKYLPLNLPLIYLVVFYCILKKITLRALEKSDYMG